MPKVSVIIPVYNASEYLRQCLQSVAAQSLKDLEVLLINDGSTDDSEIICKNFCLEDHRFKLFSIANSGAAVARNLGLEQARGDYIGFVDADDWIEVTMYQELYNRAQLGDIDIVGCELARQRGQTMVDNPVHYRAGFYSRTDIIDQIFPELICSETLENNVPRAIVTKIFRRSFLVARGIKFEPELLFGQDVVFSTHCFLHASSFHYSPDRVLYRYRYNPKSRTNSYVPNSWGMSAALLGSYKKMLDKYSDYDFARQLELYVVKSAMTSLNYIGKGSRFANIKDRLAETRAIIHDPRVHKAAALMSSNTKLQLRRRVFLLVVKFRLSMLALLLSKANALLSRASYT